MRRIVSDIILEGVSMGIFRPEAARDAEKIAMNFMAYLDGIAWHTLMTDSYFNLKEQIDYFVNNLIQTIQTSSGSSN
jgi:hypothetical protein